MLTPPPAGQTFDYTILRFCFTIIWRLLKKNISNFVYSFIRSFLFSITYVLVDVVYINFFTFIYYCRDGYGAFIKVAQTLLNSAMFGMDTKRIWTKSRYFSFLRTHILSFPNVQQNEKKAARVRPSKDFLGLERRPDCDASHHVKYQPE
jgi:hypothetical protein